ncbi:MAG: PQQ-like beta-propeller repeat protein [Pirellulales bacterium]|nr:PQQ-like beta-propeller repeat protein [Pirellulales bacterium]
MLLFTIRFWPRAITLLTTVFFLLTGLQVHSEDGNGSEWSSFRGGNRHGVVGSNLPLCWGENTNVGWRTEIRGSGNSSPVVSRDRIYITTSYQTKRNSSWRGASSLAMFIAFMGMLCLAFDFIRQECVSGKSGFSVGRYRAVCFSSLLILILLFLVFGQKGLDYERCPIRSWLGSSLVVFMCLLLCSYVPCTKSLLNLFISASAGLVAVMTVFGIPAPDHVFGQGLSSRLLVVLSVAMLPMMQCILMAGNYVMQYRIDRRCQFYLNAGLAAVGCVVLWIACAQIVSFSTDPPPAEGNPDGILWMPAFLVSVSATLIASIVLGSVVRPLKDDDPHTDDNSNTVIRLLGTVLISMCVVAAIFGTLFLSISRSYYLSYHFPDIQVSSEIGGIGLAVGVFCVLGYVVFRMLRPLPSRHYQSLQTAFCVFAYTLAVVYILQTTVLRSYTAYTRAIICIDAKSGQIKWTCEGLEGPEGQLHPLNSPATPTPVITDNSVIAWFGSRGLMCCDLNGKLKWTNPKFVFTSIYGAGSSPLVYDKKVFLAVGHPMDPAIVALDVSSGNTLWQQPMIMERNRNNISGNNRTPIIINESLVVWDFNGLCGFESSTGRKLWEIRDSSEGKGVGDMVSSPVSDGRRIYCMGKSGSFAALLTVNADNGETTRPPTIAWENSRCRANCVTPVVVNGLVFVVNDNGTAACLDAASGQIWWKRRLKGRYYSSPVTDGRGVYFTNLAGRTTIIQADREYMMVKQNEIGDKMLASLVPLYDGLLFRTRSELIFVPGDAPNDRTIPEQYAESRLLNR